MLLLCPPLRFPGQGLFCLPGTSASLNDWMVLRTVSSSPDILLHQDLGQEERTIPSFSLQQRCWRQSTASFPRPGSRSCLCSYPVPWVPASVFIFKHVLTKRVCFVNTKWNNCYIQLLLPTENLLSWTCILAYPNCTGRSCKTSPTNVALTHSGICFPPWYYYTGSIHWLLKQLNLFCWGYTDWKKYLQSIS